MKVAAAIVLLFAVSAYAAENGLPSCGLGFRSDGSHAQFLPESDSLHAYNVVRYKLYMDWFDALSGQSHGFDGRMEIIFVPSLINPLDSIRLDCNPQYLHVDSAFSSGVGVKTDQEGEKLIINLRDPVASGDTGSVELYYHETDPGIVPSPDSLQKGFYLYYRGQTINAPGQAKVQDTVAYTMSEPSDARDWMPCYDEPWDKALCQISVRVPNGFTAASNGTLISKVDNGDGSTTFNWKEDFPIATYLMCATAARYDVVQKDFIPTPDDTIPVQYYVYPDDLIQAQKGQECNIDTVISMMEFYSSLYDPYPFHKYGITGVQPFGYGGMEHQTITTMNLYYEFNRRDVAHELAHQWWGDMVTLGSWKDIWLNEGFATYSEAMQLQHLSETAFENEMLYYAGQFFNEDSTRERYAIYAPPTGYLFGLAEYYKAAWVLHMLRNIVGDTTFFDIMRRYRADYEYGNAVTSDFISVVDSVTHSNMDWFFSEWIYKAGYPVYTRSYSQSGDSVSVTIDQVQSGSVVYKMPMDVGVYSGDGLNIFEVVDSSVTQSFELPFQGKIDSLVLDPYHKILARFPGQNLTEIGKTEGQPNGYSLLQNYPNPFNDMTQIVYHVAKPGIVSVELYDVLGRKVETLAYGFRSEGVHRISVNGAKLASGVYLCRLITPDHRLTTKLVLEK